MPDYKNGKIYRLVDKNTNKIIYIGSTCSRLCERMARHRESYKKNNDRLVYKEIRKNYEGIENIIIELICAFPCNTKDELFAEERRHAELIGFGNLLNQQVPGRKIKEYMKDNKEKIKRYQKTYNTSYYEKNKDKIMENVNKYSAEHREEKLEYYRNRYREKKDYFSRKIKCECGKEITSMYSNKHKLTNYHIKHLDKNNLNTE